MTSGLPKVAVFGLDDEVARAVQRVGYPVVVGSLGSKFRTNPRRDPVVLPETWRIPPKLSEQDIVLIDMATAEGTAVGLPKALPNVPAILGPAYDGVVDCRPACAATMQPDIDKLLHHGGVVVVLAAPIASSGYFRSENPARNLDSQRTPIPSGPFPFSMLHGAIVYAEAAEGDVVQPVDSPQDTLALATLLGRYGEQTQFLTWFKIHERGATVWPTAVNKHGDVVSFVLRQERGGGLFIVLPQLSGRLAQFVVELLQQVLPDIPRDPVPSERRLHLRDRGCLTDGPRGHPSLRADRGDRIVRRVGVV